MKTAPLPQSLIVENEYNIRLDVFLREGRKHLCCVLHDPLKGNLPIDKKKLYAHLQRFKKELKHLKKDQKQLLFPSNNQTDSSSFDISILCDLFINCTNVSKPIGGWRKEPKDDDFSIGADVIRLRNLRNFILHKTLFTYQEFCDVWKKLKAVLKRLGYDLNTVKGLKSEPLDDLKDLKISILESIQKRQGENIEQCQADIQQDQAEIQNIKCKVQSHSERLNKLENDCKSKGAKRKIEIYPEKRDSTQRFYIFKNFEQDTVVQFDGNYPLHKVEVCKIDQASFEELQEGVEYHKKVVEKRLHVTLFKNAVFGVKEITFNLVDATHKKIRVTIKDDDLVCAHRFVNNCKHFVVSTHNCCEISSEIENIINTEIEYSDVEFIVGGTVHRKSHSDYKDYALEYLTRYYTSDEMYLQESVQFPPVVFKQKCSTFAAKLKSILEKTKNNLLFVITHYNSMEHLKFFKLDSQFTLNCKEIGDFNNRILILHQGCNAIINIRYTETTDELSIQQEFQRGAEDIKCLCALNKKHIIKGSLEFVNVVVAPEYKISKETSFCTDCHLLHNDIVSSERKMRDFFIKLLQHSEVIGSQENAFNEQKQFLIVLSHIVCFIATKEALYPMPTPSSNIAEQIGTLHLTSEQLRYLYHPEKKKIIIGPLGSGKTVLALSHLELICECSENMTAVVYYVVWKHNALVLKNVEKYVQHVTRKRDVTILVKSVVELAKELRFTKVPKLSLLLKRLLKNHKDATVHLIADEVDGEMFDLGEALALKHYIERENKVKDSMIVLFPESLEKHRRFESSTNAQDHDKFKYNETGMHVLQLNKSMRTTKANFEFLKAFERKLCQLESIIVHPVNETESVTSLPKVSTKDEKPLLNDRNKSTVKMHMLQKVATKNKSTFEPPIDIDVAAAANDDNTIGDAKTVTKFKCNSVDVIGHNIKGKKPIFLYLEGKDKKEDCLITMLAIALEHICLNRSDKKRLFMYNRTTQLNVFNKILNLLDMEYCCYNSSSGWKIRKHDGTLTNWYADNCNLLTDHEGCRGSEAEECLLIVDPREKKLHHLTLECMTRATSNLVLISMSNIFVEENEPSSLGGIFKELADMYLQVVHVENIEHSNTEKCYVAKDGLSGGVNVKSWKYKDFMKKIKCMKFHEEVPQRERNINAAILRNFQPPAVVQNFTCAYSSEACCELCWLDQGYHYILKTKNETDGYWELLENTASSNAYVLDNMVIGENYKFSIVATNSFGESTPIQLSYCHRPALLLKDISTNQLTNSESQPTSSTIQPTNYASETTSSTIQPTNSKSQPTSSNIQPTNSESQPTRSTSSDCNVSSIGYFEEDGADRDSENVDSYEDDNYIGDVDFDPGECNDTVHDSDTDISNNYSHLDSEDNRHTNNGNRVDDCDVDMGPDVDDDNDDDIDVDGDDNDVGNVKSNDDGDYNHHNVNCRSIYDDDDDDDNDDFESSENDDDYNVVSNLKSNDDGDDNHHIVDGNNSDDGNDDFVSSENDNDDDNNDVGNVKSNDDGDNDFWPGEDEEEDDDSNGSDNFEPCENDGDDENDNDVGNIDSSDVSDCDDDGYDDDGNDDDYQRLLYEAYDEIEENLSEVEDDANTDSSEEDLSYHYDYDFDDIVSSCSEYKQMEEDDEDI